MKVLIDEKGLQARNHLRRNKHRLSIFIAELMSISCQVFFSSITQNNLRNCDVLIITTRLSPFSNDEKDYIHNFILDGGGLLLMSNHGNLSQYDAKLADEKFGVEIQPTFFRHKFERVHTTLSESNLNSNHPIISGSPTVNSIVTNTCCSIHSDSGDCIVSLSNEMEDRLNSNIRPTSEQYFAHALEEAQGRIVTIADSGFIGSDCTTSPGPGLILHGDNLRFIKNVIRWLGGELG